MEATNTHIDAIGIGDNVWVTQGKTEHMATFMGEPRRVVVDSSDSEDEDEVENEQEGTAGLEVLIRWATTGTKTFVRASTVRPVILGQRRRRQAVAHYEAAPSKRLGKKKESVVKKKEKAKVATPAERNRNPRQPTDKKSRFKFKTRKVSRKLKGREKEKQSNFDQKKQPDQVSEEVSSNNNSEVGDPNNDTVRETKKSINKKDREKNNEDRGNPKYEDSRKEVQNESNTKEANDEADRRKDVQSEPNLEQGKTHQKQNDKDRPKEVKSGPNRKQETNQVPESKSPWDSSESDNRDSDTVCEGEKSLLSDFQKKRTKYCEKTTIQNVVYSNVIGPKPSDAGGNQKQRVDLKQSFISDSDGVKDSSQDQHDNSKNSERPQKNASHNRERDSNPEQQCLGRCNIDPENTNSKTISTSEQGNEQEDGKRGSESHSSNDDERDVSAAFSAENLLREAKKSLFSKFPDFSFKLPISDGFRKYRKQKEVDGEINEKKRTGKRNDALETDEMNFNDPLTGKNEIEEKKKRDQDIAGKCKTVLATDQLHGNESNEGIVETTNDKIFNSEIPTTCEQYKNHADKFRIEGTQELDSIQHHGKYGDSPIVSAQNLKESNEFAGKEIHQKGIHRGTDSIDVIGLTSNRQLDSDKSTALCVKNKGNGRELPQPRQRQPDFVQQRSKEGNYEIVVSEKLNLSNSEVCDKNEDLGKEHGNEIDAYKKWNSSNSEVCEKNKDLGKEHDNEIDANEKLTSSNSEAWDKNKASGKKGNDETVANEKLNPSNFEECDKNKDTRKEHGNENVANEKLNSSNSEVYDKNKALGKESNDKIVGNEKLNYSNSEAWEENKDLGNKDLGKEHDDEIVANEKLNSSNSEVCEKIKALGKEDNSEIVANEKLISSSSKIELGKEVNNEIEKLNPSSSKVCDTNKDSSEEGNNEIVANEKLKSSNSKVCDKSKDLGEECNDKIATNEISNSSNSKSCAENKDLVKESVQKDAEKLDTGQERVNENNTGNDTNTNKKLNFKAFQPFKDKKQSKDQLVEKRNHQSDSEHHHCKDCDDGLSVTTNIQLNPNSSNSLKAVNDPITHSDDSNLNETSTTQDSEQQHMITSEDRVIHNCRISDTDEYDSGSFERLEQQSQKIGFSQDSEHSIDRCYRWEWATPQRVQKNTQIRTLPGEVSVTKKPIPENYGKRKPQSWNEAYALIKELRHFDRSDSQEEGRFDIPSEHPILGEFVHKFRQEYSKFRRFHRKRRKSKSYRNIDSKSPFNDMTRISWARITLFRRLDLPLSGNTTIRRENIKTGVANASVDVGASSNSEIETEDVDKSSKVPLGIHTMSSSDSSVEGKDRMSLHSLDDSKDYDSIRTNSDVDGSYEQAIISLKKRKGRKKIVDGNIEEHSNDDDFLIVSKLTDIRITDSRRTSKDFCKATLPIQLYRLLRLSSLRPNLGLNKIIRWTDDGNSFEILDETVFLQNVLSKISNISKESSFRNALRQYRFRGVKFRIRKNGCTRRIFQHQSIVEAEEASDPSLREFYRGAPLDVMWKIKSRIQDGKRVISSKECSTLEKTSSSRKRKRLSAETLPNHDDTGCDETGKDGSVIHIGGENRHPKVTKPLSREAERKLRRTNDGCLLPKDGAEQLLMEDGTYDKPRGKQPYGLIWDSIRGLWAPPHLLATKQDDSSIEEDDDDLSRKIQGGWDVDHRNAERRTSDGCFLPKHDPILLDDGTYKQPKGHVPRGLSWDKIRGLWAPLDRIAKTDGGDKGRSRRSSGSSCGKNSTIIEASKVKLFHHSTSILRHSFHPKNKKWKHRGNHHSKSYRARTKKNPSGIVKHSINLKNWMKIERLMQRSSEQRGMPIPIAPIATSSNTFSKEGEVRLV